jgi:ABC-type antimicrobial peptide transport system permease subunit
VVVVNRAMAERAWPAEEAVGKRLRFRAPDAPARTVVGVVADVKNQTLGEVVDPMVYLPTTQRYVAGLNVLAAGPGAGPAALRRAILEADPRLSVGTPQELAELVGLGILPQRVAATLATALGGLALFLSVLGVYGVVAHSVAGRGRELGIRMAVGASRGGVVALVLRGGARMVLPGLVVGAIAALGLGQVVRSLLFGVSPADGTTLAAVVLVMAGAVLLATGIPALRAARQDPMEALRSE